MNKQDVIISHHKLNHLIMEELDKENKQDDFMANNEEYTPEQETEQSPGDKEFIYARLKKSFPDQEFDDDEKFYRGLRDYTEQRDKQIDNYAKGEKEIVDLFNKDGRSAAFISDWMHGENPVVGLVRRYGDELKEALDDPELAEDLAKAEADYLDKVASSKKLDEEYEKNIANSLEVLQQFADEKGMDDEQTDELLQHLFDICHNGIVGIYDKDTMEMIYTAMHHDEQMEMAEHKGEVRGRNTKIKEQLRTREDGDGVQALGGSNNSQPQDDNINDIFSQAAAAR